MATRLKVSGAQAYQLHREVGAVSPYPRVDPQRPRGEDSPARREGRGEKRGHVRRRFDAMRRLIDILMKESTINRVDYLTSIEELTELGFSILEKELLEQLLTLGFSTAELNSMLGQIAQKEVVPDLKPGRLLAEAHSFFPVYVSGLSEYNFCFPPLSLSAAHPLPALSEALESHGFYVTEKNRLRLDFRVGGGADSGVDLTLTISVLVGGSEVDEEGRRVVLYRRSDHRYALYADKQIDLSI